jgi:hypothetical protein
MMVKYEVDTVDLPATDSRFELSEESEENGVEDRGEIIRIDFEPTEQEQRAGANKPRVGTLEELKISFITWLEENKPNVLDCQLERYLTDRRHKVLWTPPYCPDLQPIELFWAAGKNHVANHFIDGIKMKQTVSRLRDGWYGNSDRFQEGDDEFHAVTDCKKLVQHAIGCADATFIPLSDGISGTIGALTIDTNYERDTTGIPIDTLVVDLTNQVDCDEDVSVTSSTA